MSEGDKGRDQAEPPVVGDRWRLPESANQAFLRGLSLRCPLCAEGRLFHGWVRMRNRCEHCGFVFDRGPGYFLGSTYINYGITTLSTTATYIWLRFGMGVAKTVLVPVLASFCVIFPLVFFRYARSLWLSFDCWLDRQGAMDGREELR
jgi:uncharacterized protein (DUF983 family)